MKVILEMLSYPFLVRALVVGVLVSMCASLLGVSLVLKRYSMIGDGLSHVGFGALAIATALNLAPLAVAVPVVVVAAFLLLRLSQNGKLKGDAAIALLSSSALAIGVMTVSMTSGMNTDVNNYMFGSILSLSSADLRLSLILSAAVLALKTTAITMAIKSPSRAMRTAVPPSMRSAAVQMKRKKSLLAAQASVLAAKALQMSTSPLRAK